MCGRFVFALSDFNIRLSFVRVRVFSENAVYCPLFVKKRGVNNFIKRLIIIIIMCGGDN